MINHVFLNDGPSFSQVRDILQQQYTNPVFDPETGLSPEELRDGFYQIVECTADEAPLLQKSHLIAFILQNARIDVDPRDFFADHFQGLGLLEKLREEKRRSIGNAKIPQTVETLKRAAVTGFYNAELDLGHISPDWSRILKLGVAGILEEALKMQASLPEDHPSRTFYQSVIETYSAIRIYILRLSVQARKMAGLYPEYRWRMIQLSNALQNLADNAPSTFYEALQLSYIFHQLIEYEGEYVRSMGSFERNFGSFYEEDLRSGYLTRETAEELIRFYWMKYFAKTLGKNNGKNFYFGGLHPRRPHQYGTGK